RRSSVVAQPVAGRRRRVRASPPRAPGPPHLRARRRPVARRLHPRPPPREPRPHREGARGRARGGEEVAAATSPIRCERRATCVAPTTTTAARIAPGGRCAFSVTHVLAVRVATDARREPGGRPRVPRPRRNGHPPPRPSAVIGVC